MISVVHRFLLAQEFRLLIAALILTPVPWLMEYGQDHALLADRYLLQEFHSDEGRAAFAWIPEFIAPALAERGFRVCEGESVSEEMPSLQVQCFHPSLGGALHRDIRREGGGLHDFDGVEVLRFSSSDGSHPTDNGRVYLLSVPWGTRGVRARVEVACQAPIALFAYVLARKRMWPWIHKRYTVISTGIGIRKRRAVGIGREWIRKSRAVGAGIEWIRKGRAVVSTGSKWIRKRRAVGAGIEWIRKGRAVVSTGREWIRKHRAVSAGREWIRNRREVINNGFVLLVLVLLVLAISLEACLR